MNPGEVGILVAFLFGGLSFLSPCVLPLLPGYLSLMSGYSVADIRAGQVSSGSLLKVMIGFVLGFTLVFVLLGAAATGVGTYLRAHTQGLLQISGWLVVGFGALVVVMALVDLPGLAFLTRERRLDLRPSRLGSWAPPVMGMAFGFGWTPCIGPVLTVILLTAGTQETIGQGVVLLLSYSLGLGVPFLLTGLGAHWALRSFESLRRWLRTINVASGALLIGFGVLMITDRLFELNGMITRFMTRIGIDITSFT